MHGKYGKKRRGIYLLPNLITTVSLFLGFLAIVQALAGRFETAALLVFVSAVLDGLDGHVARMTDTATRFGAEYDSLNDAVVFGVVPALVIYLWAFSGIGPEQVWHRVGLLAAFFYLVSTLMRLARFNSQHSSEKYFFRGVPSPAAAVFIMSMVWAWQDFGYKGEHLVWLCLTATVVASAFMVSNFSYYSLKGLNLKDRIPFVALFAVVVGFVIAAIDFPSFLFSISLIYMFSGPFLYCFRRWFKPLSAYVARQHFRGKHR